MSNEREQFEARCIRVYGRCGVLLERDVNGEYIDAAVWSGWQWWQARASLSAPVAERGQPRHYIASEPNQKLWLWKNGDHFLAYAHEYPCIEPDGDPATLGEPFGYAIFKVSYDRQRNDHQSPRDRETAQLQRSNPRRGESNVARVVPQVGRVAAQADQASSSTVAPETGSPHSQTVSAEVGQTTKEAWWDGHTTEQVNLDDFLDSRPGGVVRVPNDEVLRAERGMAQAQRDHAVRILTGIHALLYPPPTTVEGKTYVFRPGTEGEDMQRLCDAMLIMRDWLAAAPQPPAEARERVLLCRFPGNRCTPASRWTGPTEQEEAGYRSAGFEYRYATLDPTSDSDVSGGKGEQT